MGRDIVAAAKEFEDHASKGARPESLARELHSMSNDDRLAVAKQIEWDKQHQSNVSLPKLEFYDSGDLKSVEKSGQSGSDAWKEHVQLDKNTGKVKIESRVDDQKTSYDRTVSSELTEYDSNGNRVHHAEVITTTNGAGTKVSYDDDTYTYDATSGKKLSHDERTSDGKKLHEEYDATTGKEKSADETNRNGTVHRTYDPTTGNLRQEDFTNNDKTHDTIKYNSNGDKLSKERQYGPNGSEGTREWVYSPRTGKEVYTEFRNPNGKITKFDIDENGKYTEKVD
jgi:hypothetical protein